MQGFVLSSMSLIGEGLLLAQTTKGTLSPEDRSAVLFWCIVILILGIAIGIAGYITYRKIKNSAVPTEEDAGFSLSQMRRLYEAGEISHEEYTQLREKILIASRATMLGTDESQSLAAISKPAAKPLADTSSSIAPPPIGTTPPIATREPGEPDSTIEPEPPSTDPLSLPPITPPPPPKKSFFDDGPADGPAEK